ncbi:hypothetical protein FNJ84_11910 [Paracoccus sp. M683]|uniref:hypothetical protein n=1 Tax=Paracoccus sp. M683 TaxID=2594268 RepID=UPI00118128B0|nr:hypothetical protein [Paracoccus sp. M683]TRW96769.1 hypothetical protein FNJ84_11910 [Paracoccus sp. M683]
MKFSTRRDTELTADQLFQSIADFDRLERILLRRGAAVTRIGTSAAPGPGWDIGFDWRGRRRDLRLQVVRFNQPEQIAMQGESEAFELLIDLTVVALSRLRSRLILEADIRPRNMRARLMLQTARLGKSQLDKRFDEGAARLLAELTGLRA